MTAGAGQFAALSSIVFVLGLFGVLNRRSTVGVLLALVLLTVAPVIALAGFAHLGTVSSVAPVGDAFGLLALVAAAAELVAGTGLAALAWRRLGSTDSDLDTETG